MSMQDALKSGLIVHSPQGMEAVGRGIARELLSNGGTLALYGDLGAGKTTLVRGIASALGIEEVTSPSFNYYFLYKGCSPAFQGRAINVSSLRDSITSAQPQNISTECKLQLLHLDAYRLARPEDYPSLMIDELITPETLFVIEWPEKLGEFLPKSSIKLQMSIVKEGVHKVEIVAN